jgi:fibronectin type 3 domain-containing protein
MMLIALTMSFIACQAIAQFSVTMPYKQVTVQNVNGEAKFSGAQIVGVPGQPALPTYTVTFLLPPDADVSSVTASINNSIDQELSGQYNVAPNRPIPGPDGKITWPKGMIVVDGKDMAVYGKNAFTMSSYQGRVETGMMYQYKLVDIQIYPYKYNPVTKKLRMISGGTLSVTFKTGSAEVDLPRNTDAEKMLKSKLVNFSELDNYGYLPSSSQLMLQSVNTLAAASSAASAAAPVSTSDAVSGKTYLIITTSQIVNSTPALTPYMDMLRSNGANVVILTENEWASAGSTTQQKCDDIRATVGAQWAVASKMNLPLKYLLLIGNPDTAVGDVPMKNWNGITDREWANGIPTDHYYADISNDWTEFGPDKYSEITVGRIPVYGDVSVVNTYLNRAIAYENAWGYDTEWRRSYLGLAEILGFSPESYEQSENLVAAITPKGWNCSRIYGSYSIFASYNNFMLLPQVVNMNPLADYTVMNVYLAAKKWNYDAPGFVYAGGHGYSGGVGNVLQTNPLSSAYPENVSLLNSTYPAAVVTASCATIDPIAPDNCGAMTLYKNAISYTGFSVPVYGPGRTTEPYALSVLDNLPFGDALVNAKITSGDLTHCLQFNLYGCPEASLNLQTLASVGTPKNFKAAASTTSKSIVLTWSAVSNATSYAIERSSVHGESKIDGFSNISFVERSKVTFTDNNVVAGTCYKYRIYAYDAYNRQSAFSPIDSTTTFYGVTNQFCIVPTNLRVTNTQSNMVALTWTGSAKATYYNVKRSTNANGPFVTITSPFSSEKTTTTNFIDYNVMNGTTYYYVVSSVNQYGETANSTSVSTTPSFNLAAPAITSISADQQSNVTINWTSAYNTVCYEFEWAYKFPDGSIGDYTSFGPIYRFGNTFTFSPGDIPCNSNVMIRMRGKGNDYSQMTAYSNVVNITTGSGPVPRCTPVTPSSLTAIASAEKITLTWVHNQADPYSIPSSFEIFRKEGNGTWYRDYTWIDSTSRTIDLSYLSINTKYQFCMRAVVTKRFGDPVTYYSSFTPIVTATTPNALLAPTALEAKVSARGKIDLTWNENSNARTGFYIEQATNPSGPFTQVGTSSYGSYQRSGLADGTQYYFRVRAYSGSVTSAYSNTAGTTTASNLASGKTSTAQSYQSTNPVKNGNDNSTSTRWAASSGSVPQWWKVDLGANRTIYGTEVLWEKSGSGFVYKYKIETSTNNSTWVTVANKTGNTSTAQLQAQNFSEISARYVRITITGAPTNCWASFYEFRAFGK